ncbi:MAG: NADH-quinone oxidoreductase subunit C [Acidobacteriota bacterium]
MPDEAPPPPPKPPAKPPDPLEAEVPCPALHRLRQEMPETIGEPHYFAGEVTLSVEPRSLLKVCRFLRDDPECHFEMLVDITGTDFPEREDRFQMSYHLASLEHRTRLRLHSSVAEGTSIPSITGIWPGADWFEREIYDLLGVTFEGHPNLVRVLMPDDWVGHPLRKDYPLPGHPEQHIRYRVADVTKRAYVDISWKAAGEKAAAIVKKYGGTPPAQETSPHTPHHQAGSEDPSGNSH